jgi:hypothetical protein
MKQYYINNPEERQKKSERMKQYYSNPENREKIRKNMKQYNRDHPEILKKHGEKMKQYYSIPEHKTKILDTRGKNKSFDVFTKDGTFVKTFNYIFEANEYLKKEHNIKSNKIGEVLNGNRNSTAGFVFKYT